MEHPFELDLCVCMCECVTVCRKIHTRTHFWTASKLSQTGTQAREWEQETACTTSVYHNIITICMRSCFAQSTAKYLWWLLYYVPMRLKIIDNLCEFESRWRDGIRPYGMWFEMWCMYYAYYNVFHMNKEKWQIEETRKRKKRTCSKSIKIKMFDEFVHECVLSRIIMGTWMSLLDLSSHSSLLARLTCCRMLYLKISHRNVIRFLCAICFVV